MQLSSFWSSGASCHLSFSTELRANVDPQTHPLHDDQHPLHVQPQQGTHSLGVPELRYNSPAISVLLFSQPAQLLAQGPVTDWG
jgi:hypothetical protein